MRLMMIWLAMLGQIAVGALVTLKSHALYASYASPDLADEQRGGFLIWIPSAMILLAALLVVVNLWRRHEAFLDEKRTRWTPSNSAILLYPETGRALRQMAAGKNRRLAYGMAGFVLFIFSMACIVAAGSEFAAHHIDSQIGIRLQR
jgi:putative membrane protein